MRETTAIKFEIDFSGLATRLRGAADALDPEHVQFCRSEGCAANAEMLGLIREIANQHGAEAIPFLDDAVRFAIENARPKAPAVKPRERQAGVQCQGSPGPDIDSECMEPATEKVSGNNFCAKCAAVERAVILEEDGPEGLEQAKQPDGAEPPPAPAAAPATGEPPPQAADAAGGYLVPPEIAPALMKALESGRSIIGEPINISAAIAESALWGRPPDDDDGVRAWHLWAVGAARPLCGDEEAQKPEGGDLLAQGVKPRATAACVDCAFQIGWEAPGNLSRPDPDPQLELASGGAKAQLEQLNRGVQVEKGQRWVNVNTGRVATVQMVVPTNPHERHQVAFRDIVTDRLSYAALRDLGLKGRWRFLGPNCVAPECTSPAGEKSIACSIHAVDASIQREWLWERIGLRRRGGASHAGQEAANG